MRPTTLPRRALAGLMGLGALACSSPDAGDGGVDAGPRDAPEIDTGPAGTTIAHAGSFTISGSGFGSRAGLFADIFDDCSAASVDALWNDAVGFTYQTPAAHGLGVDVPHPHVAQFAVGELETYFNAWLSRSVAGYRTPTNVLVMAYRRVDPGWTFGPECDTGSDADNNFKYLVVSAGGTWFGGSYWYHDQTDQKCSLADPWGDSFYSSGGLGALSHQPSTSGGSASTSTDPWHEWVKFEYRMRMAASGGFIRYRLNGRPGGDVVDVATDGEGADGTAFSIGAYVRQDGHGPRQVIYLADIVLVVGDDALARVILADTEDLGLATLVEFQPIVSWSDTSITIRVNRGGLPTGGAWLHVVDASDTVVATQRVDVRD
jgi:hypothetical protein